jgi:hypothetical protein
MDAVRRWNHLAAWVAFAVVFIGFWFCSSGMRAIALLILGPLPFFVLAAVAFYNQRASKREPPGQSPA